MPCVVATFRPVAPCRHGCGLRLVHQCRVWVCFYAQMVNGAKMQRLQPQLKLNQARMMEARQEGRRDKLIELNNERKVRSHSA